MSLDAGGIELKFGQLLLEFGLGQSLENLLPDAPLAPAVEPTPDAVPIAEAFGEIPPGNAGLQDIEHRVDERAVVGGRSWRIGFSSGQQRFDPVPLLVGELMSSASHWCPPCDADSVTPIADKNRAQTTPRLSTLPRAAHRSLTVQQPWKALSPL